LGTPTIRDLSPSLLGTVSTSRHSQRPGPCTPRAGGARTERWFTRRGWDPRSANRGVPVAPYCSDNLWGHLAHL